jgi:hypothetical protein
MSSEPKRKSTETPSQPQPQQQTQSQQQTQLQQQTPQQAGSTQRLPSDVTFQNATKLAITEDKPIMMDYWADSLDGKALIGVRENNEKMLVKSAEEYTSPIAKLYRSGTEYIVMTENSIYIVSSTIPTRRIA